MNKQSLVLLALLLSVALNLLVAGVIIGRAGGPAANPPPMDWAARGMEPQTRDMIRARLREQQADFRPIRREIMAARGAVRRAITASDYDPAALASALAQVRDVSGRYQRLIHENLVEMSAELPREQRMALARAVLERDQEGNMPSRPPEQRR